MSVVFSGEVAGEHTLFEFPDLESVSTTDRATATTRILPIQDAAGVDVAAMTFRGDRLFVGVGRKIYEFYNLRDLSAQAPVRTLPAGLGEIRAMEFEPNLRTLWIIERRAGESDARVKFTDLDDLTAHQRLSINDPHRLYEGMAILGSTMYLAAYPPNQATNPVILPFTGDGYGSAGTPITDPDLHGPLGLSRYTDTGLLVMNGDRTLLLFPEMPSTNVKEQYGPYLEDIPIAQSIAWADLDPAVDTDLPARPLDISIPFIARALLTLPSALGSGSPLGKSRDISEVSIGLFRSRGGLIRQRGTAAYSGRDDASPVSNLVTPAVLDELGQSFPHGRAFSGELTVQIHDLGTDPTATLMIEQRDSEDFEVTYVSIDVESED